MISCEGIIMKITPYENELSILQEVGKRIKQYRISLNITQQQMAQQCGLSVATLSRVENGDDTKWSVIIRILKTMKLVENLDVLIPETQMDYKSLFEKTTIRQRVRQDKSDQQSGWVWQEDKEGE